MSHLHQRLLRGLSAQGFSQTVQIFIRVAEVPLLLSFWGTQLYGEWLMISAIPAYLAMGDGGFAGSASREMGMRSGAGDREGALSVFQSTWVFLLRISLLLGLVVVAVVEIAPLARWLHFEAMDSRTLEPVTLLLLAQVLIGFQASLINGGFWCERRYAEGMFLSAMTQLFEFGGLAVAVVFGGGPVRAASASLAGSLGGLILLRLALYRAAPWLRYGWQKASPREIRRLAAPAIASLAFPVGNALNIQGMRLVVGLALGPAAVAIFSPIRTLSRFVIQSTTVITRLIEPEMALAFGGSNHDLFRSIFSRSCQVALWAGMGSCMVLGAAGEKVLRVWTHGEVVMNWPLFILLLFTAAANCLWYTALMVPYATNRHMSIAWFYACVYGGVAFVVAYFGARLAGLAGVSAALLLAEIAVAVYVLPAALRLSGVTWRSWLWTLGHPPLFLLQGFRGTRN